MTRRYLKTLGFVSALGLLIAACSSEGVSPGSDSVDIDFHATVAVDFHALHGDVEAETRRGDIVYDLRKAADYVDFEDQIRCVGLDPFTSLLTITRLDSEGLESFLDFGVEIAPYPNGDWTPLADFTSLVTDQSIHGFNAPGFTIYYEGLDVLEAVAFAATPQFELRITSTVPSDVMALEIELDLAVALSSVTNACPGPAH
jgi:hypothetical protein